MFRFPGLENSRNEFAVPKGEVVIRAPAQYSKNMPWGNIPKTVKTVLWGRNDPDELIVTEGINEGERGLFVLRNESEKFNRYVSLGNDGTCYCEIVLPDETRQRMKEGGWLKVRELLNSRAGPEHHQVHGENVDPDAEKDVQRMTRVIESLGTELAELLGQRVIFKATGRHPILRYSGIIRERLSRQFTNMRNLEKRFAQKPIPGIRVCKQFGYVRFPNQGPQDTEFPNRRDDLEYIFMEQVEGTPVPFEKHMLVYTSRMSDEYVRNDPASFFCKFSDNPHLKSIVDFLTRELAKIGNRIYLQYDSKYEEAGVTMEELRGMIVDYVGLRGYRREAVLGDFYPRNLLLEKRPDGSEELVIIDQYPHHD